METEAVPESSQEGLPIEGRWYRLSWPPPRKLVIDLEPAKEHDALKDYIGDSGFDTFDVPVIAKLDHHQYDVFVSDNIWAQFEATNSHLEVMPFESNDELVSRIGKVKAAEHAIMKFEALLEGEVLPGTKKAIEERMWFYQEVRVQLV
ncbi:hypothetical protein LOZ66_006953 [Ophidiomyces ophidiicola]|nr:hypothetical protein LOZ66_006953 [Ophidiomyces ophidiicola]